MNEPIIATARLVRPAYRTPVIAEPQSYLELLEDQRDQLLEENQGLKTRLIGLQAELARAVALTTEHSQAISLLTSKLDGERRSVRLADQVKMPSARTSRKWVAGYVRRDDRFPADMAKRTGVAAILQQPLALRSGAVLYPLHKAVVRGGLSITFPDSCWLVLSVLAERPGEYVTQRELVDRVFNGRTASGVRTAIARARQTLASVDAHQDLETGPKIGQSWRGWRLMLAESP